MPKQNRTLCKLSRPCVNRIVQQAFDSKRVRKNFSGEIEERESYFLFLYTRNCVVEGAKRVRGKRGRGVGKKTSMLLLRATHSFLCKQ